MKRKKILIFGASGMLGRAVCRFSSKDDAFSVYGTFRNGKSDFIHENLKSICHTDVENENQVFRAFELVRPDVVINCVGIVKQLDFSEDVLTCLPINSVLPHKLARICSLVGARLIHISTDCVFSGSKGKYLESDFPDANDLYGRTKFIGEVDYPNAITLRTSIIGHELSGSRSLLCWFLAQEGEVKGFTKAVFSGLPTNELARVIRDFVIPNSELRGVYHVASQPIDKYSLLKLVATVYKKSIDVMADDRLIIDRSLNADRFMLATGYVAPAWPELIEGMYNFNCN